MATDKRTKLVGLCKQCEHHVVGCKFDWSKARADFANLPEDRRSVFCYSCGQIRVGDMGECMTKCSSGHNWSWFDKLMKWFNAGYIPKRLSE